jgi:hypothetical protein
MSWPIPVFTKIEYPKPISMRSWLPTLAAIAACAVAAVLLLWPHGKPTNTFQFWSALVGAPLVACALVFGIRLNDWEDEQTDAEEAEREQDRLQGMWREWSRRNLRVVDAEAFTAATKKISTFAEAKVDLPTNRDRAVGFALAKNRSIGFRRRRLLHVVARRFAGDLRSRREVVITLMLDDTSPEQIKAWTQLVERFFGRITPGLTVRVEAQLVTSGVQWITQLVDTVDPSTRLVIAAQFWAGDEKEHKFSEGAAAFLIEPGETKTGSIFRPMTSARDTLEAGLSQIQEIQTSPEQLTHVWSAGCEFEDSSVLRSVLKAKPKDPVIEHLLDGFLGYPGPASGWIALAIAMEAMRGAGPQLVAWREPKSESLYLCTISPVPQKETTV